MWRDRERKNKHGDACEYELQLMNAMVTLVRNHLQALLREHAHMLKLMSQDHAGDMTELRFSKRTVDRHLRRQGFTRIKILRLFRESTEERRRQHALVWKRIPRRCIVSVDETHMDGSDVFRLYVRTLSQERSNLHAATRGLCLAPAPPWLSPATSASLTSCPSLCAKRR